MKVSIDIQACIGCGICPAICPQVFKMNDLGDKAEVENSNFPAHAASIEEARISCPTRAILVQN